MAQAWRNAGRWSAGLCSLLSFLVLSCATPEEPETPTAPMDVAIDTGGQGMLYTGVGRIPRSFESPTSFEMGFDLSHWGNPPANDASARAHTALGDAFDGSGIYQPLAGGQGVVSLAAGRLLLRGVVKEDGQKLDGDWFFDGKLGGGFQIAPKGDIFP